MIFLYLGVVVVVGWDTFRWDAPLLALAVAVVLLARALVLALLGPAINALWYLRHRAHARLSERIASFGSASCCGARHRPTR